MGLAELAGLVVALVMTVGVLSYALFGNHELFRGVAAVFVGVTAGYAAAVVMRTFVIPRLIQPFLVRHWVVVVPLVLGLLLLLRGTRFGGLATPVLAFLVGVAAATLLVGVVLGTLFPQVLATWKEWSGFRVWLTPAQGMLSWLFVIAVLVAFHFGRHEDWPRALQYPFRGLRIVGRFVVVVTLAVLFLRVYQSALLALAERVLFLWEALRFLLLGP